MFNSKRENLNKIAIFTIAILLVLATIINISLAYFTDSASTKGGFGEIRLGTIAIKVSVAGENYVVENGKVKFTLTADEVTQSEVYRTIILENADGKKTEDFAMRMASNSNSSKVIAGVSSKETEYVDSADLISDNWLTGTDNKSYFTKFVHLPEGKKVYIPVVIKMNNLSSSDFTSSLYVTFDIEVIQAANDGYKSWETKPASLNITKTYTPLNEYTKLKYIESTGVEAIDTGVIASDDITINCDFSALVFNDNRNYIIGVFKQSSSTANRTQFSYSSSSLFGWGDGFEFSSSLTLNTNKHNLTMNKTSFTFDGNKVYTVSSHTFDSSADTIYLFGCHNGSVTLNGVRIYACKIFNNGTLVRNLIPSKNASGVAGMYDTVTKTFLTNVGTGAFVAGPEV